MTRQPMTLREARRLNIIQARILDLAKAERRMPEMRAELFRLASDIESYRDGRSPSSQAFESVRDTVPCGPPAPSKSAPRVGCPCGSCDTCWRNAGCPSGPPPWFPGPNTEPDSASTEPEIGARCHCCCKITATREAVNREVTWRQLCELCWSAQSAYTRGSYEPPDGRFIQAPNTEPDSAPNVALDRPSGGA